MDIRRSIPIKVISVVVLFFFCWTFGGLFDIAYAAKNEIKQAGKNKPKKEKPEEKFEKTLNDLEQALLDTKTDTNTKKNNVKAKKNEIEALDIEIKKQFTDTEKKLKDEGLPQEILERHYNFVKHYENNLNELKNNLDKIEKAKDKKEADEAINKTQKFLEKVKPPKKHVPLDPNKLPHRTPEAQEVTLEERSPNKKIDPSEFLKKRTELENIQYEIISSNPTEPILVASNGSLTGIIDSPLPNNTYSQEPILLAQASDPPTSADLAETIEVQFTPAIQAKAAELNHHPVKIYNWVRNNIEFVPTYGSIQGADYCLQTKQCNAFDTSSLLIALLRTSGIHARYVKGTIELPIEKVKNWVGGFTDSMAALRLMASGGIPTKGMTVGGEIKYVRLEHVWVEAWIDYFPSRGARHKTGQGDTWIRLDASFKQYNYKEPIDFLQAVGLDSQGFIDEILSESTIDPSNSSISNVPQELVLQKSTEFIQNVRQYYDANLQGKTIEDIFGIKKVISQEFSYLMGTLPHKIIAIGNKYSQLPDSLRWRVNFKLLSSIYSIDPDFSYTTSTAFMAGKSITLSYRPSSTYDETLIQKSGFIETTPPYLLKLTPELIIEGEVKTSGVPVTSGGDIDFIMTFVSPDGSQDIVTNKQIAGVYLGIGLDFNYIPQSILDKKMNKLQQIYDNPNTNSSRKIQENLNLLATLYFAEVDALNMLQARFAKVVDTRLPSFNIVGEELSIKYLFGMPLAVAFEGFFIDVDRDIHTTEARDGDENKKITFNMNSGYNSSAMEHALWEFIYKLKGVSAVKILKYSNETGIPVYKVDESNVSSILPLLQISPEVKNDITNIVQTNKIVYIPQSNVDYFGWNGTAYIAMDPNTGAAGYIIFKGLAGGSDSGDEQWWDCIESLTQIFDLIPLCKGSACSRLLSRALDITAFAFARTEQATAQIEPETEDGASFLAFLNLVIGLLSTHPRVGPSVGFCIVVTIVEVLIWAKTYEMVHGAVPILEENPLQDCADIFTDLGCEAFEC